ncbi:hypothetical protein [Caldimonas tepidiphila]|uniref:hypothetical protein n=1 Tax=Caldimonas tepidiphila TaxID=2315841 RepID=UPI001300BE0C|nr:hypothetical protein [Caldimonas tepidiphila]
MRTIYPRTAASMHSDSVALGIALFTELVERFDRAPQLLIAAAYLDAGCCLDAPELLPAGGCYGEDWGDAQLAHQLTVARG